MISHLLLSFQLAGSLKDTLLQCPSQLILESLYARLYVSSFVSIMKKNLLLFFVIFVFFVVNSFL